MPLATYDAINLTPSPAQPPRYRIGYDTKTGAIHVTLEGSNEVVAYLEPRESREMAANILACKGHAQQHSEGLPK